MNFVMLETYLNCDYISMAYQRSYFTFQLEIGSKSRVFYFKGGDIYHKNGQEAPCLHVLVRAIEKEGKIWRQF